MKIEPQKEHQWLQKFVGEWWTYEGSLDATEKALTLNTLGPDFTTPGKTVQYRDVIEFKSDDHRAPTSYALGDDGQWRQFMLANYRRKK